MASSLLFTASLGGSGGVAPAIERYVVPATEPDTASVDTAAELVRSTPGAIVIGIGGGSALDTAKQAAVVTTAPMGVEHYTLGANPLPGHRPMIAIPTAAGTGAEVTRTCVVTDGDGRKVWTWGDELLPDLVVLDPASTVTMPTHVTTATGLDAFVHALEAVSGRRSTALVTASALHALRLVVDPLPITVAAPNDLEARQAMQEAALLAGLAIDGGGTGIAHSIGHALGTHAHVPHGITVAIGLAAALDWNIDGESDATRRPRPHSADRLASSPTCSPSSWRRSRCLLRSIGFPRWSWSPNRSRPRWSPRRTSRCTATTAGWPTTTSGGSWRCARSPSGTT